MIVDCVQLYLRAGNGGQGACCLERLSSRRTIGAGGDGGNGGSIFFKVDPSYYDLSKFRMNKKFIAADGGRGREHNKKGKSADSLFLSLPKGTIVRDLAGSIIVDLVDYNQEFLVCRGGAGGEGNYRSSYTIPAQAGEAKEVILDYRIFNDIAIVGFPNSGKTSLFNVLTGKSYKVASYPFTTNSCMWAHMLGEDDPKIVLDTPPLKKQVTGSQPQDSFLKHLYRSKIVLFLSDDPNLYEEEFAVIRERLGNFDPGIIKDKKIFYLLTKVDKIDKTDEMEETVEKNNVLMVSAQKGTGIDKLKNKMNQYLSKI